MTESAQWGRFSENTLDEGQSLPQELEVGKLAGELSLAAQQSICQQHFIIHVQTTSGKQRALKLGTEKVVVRYMGLN